MLDRIWVETRDEEVILIPVFRYYANAERLLKKYEERYNFRVENLQRAKNLNYQENNAYYLKVKEKLNGVYEL